MNAMLTLFLILAGTSVFSTKTMAAPKLQAALSYPMVAGTMGQNFNSRLGFNGALYFDPILSPVIHNFVSVGYSAFIVRADQKTFFRLIPILVGLEASGKVSEDVRTTFALAVGATVGYLDVPNANSYRSWGYFTAQFRPGIEWDVTSGFSVFIKTPVSVLASTKSLSMVACELGAQYQF